jgi:hypothetical protein
MPPVPHKTRDFEEEWAGREAALRRTMDERFSESSDLILDSKTRDPREMLGIGAQENAFALLCEAVRISYEAWKVSPVDSPIPC